MCPQVPTLELEVARIASGQHGVVTRRQLLRGAACTIAGVVVSKLPDSSAAPGQSVELADETLAFIRRCVRADGGYDPSPDPASLIQAGRVASAKRDLVDAHTMSWGHAMQPGKIY